jgi:tetratricopeptide (TPR) repeat protein
VTNSQAGPELPIASGTPENSSDGVRDADTLAAEAQSHLVKGRLKEAESAILSALDQPDKKATYYATLGRVWTLQNRTNEAKAAYRHALLLESKYAVAHYRLGELLLKTGELPEAEKELRLAIHFAPKSSAFHSTLADVLLNQYFLDDAQSQLVTAIRRDKKNTRAHVLMAKLLTMQGNYRGAEHEIRVALALQSTPANYETLSDILKAQSRTTEAIAAIQEACKRNPKNKAYQARLADLMASNGVTASMAAAPGKNAAPSALRNSSVPAAGLVHRIRAFLSKLKIH